MMNDPDAGCQDYGYRNAAERHNYHSASLHLADSIKMPKLLLQFDTFMRWKQGCFILTESAFKSLNI